MRHYRPHVVKTTHPLEADDEKREVIDRGQLRSTGCFKPTIQDQARQRDANISRTATKAPPLGSHGRRRNAREHNQLVWCRSSKGADPRHLSQLATLDVQSLGRQAILQHE